MICISSFLVVTRYTESFFDNLKEIFPKTFLFSGLFFVNWTFFFNTFNQILPSWFFAISDTYFLARLKPLEEIRGKNLLMHNSTLCDQQPRLTQDDIFKGWCGNKIFFYFHHFQQLFGSFKFLPPFFWLFFQVFHPSKKGIKPNGTSTSTWKSY